MRVSQRVSLNSLSEGSDGEAPITCDALHPLYSSYLNQGHTLQATNCDMGDSSTRWSTPLHPTWNHPSTPFPILELNLGHRGFQRKWLLSWDHWELRAQHRVFTGVGKAILEERYKTDQLNDKKSREDVSVLISGDGKPLVLVRRVSKILGRQLQRILEETERQMVWA